jgi:hypothetical protein
MAIGQLPQQQPLLTITMIASETIIANTFVMVTGTTEGYVSICTDNSFALGVALNAGDAGDEIVVATHGIVYVTAYEAVACHAWVHSGASTGRANDDVATTDYQAGFSLTAATAAGDLIAVLLTPGSFYK